MSSHEDSKIPEEQDGITTIQLYRKTKRKLDDKKKTGESYDDVIKRIIGE